MLCPSAFSQAQRFSTAEKDAIQGGEDCDAIQDDRPSSSPEG